MEDEELLMRYTPLYSEKLLMKATPLLRLITQAPDTSRMAFNAYEQTRPVNQPAFRATEQQFSKQQLEELQRRKKAELFKRVIESAGDASYDFLQQVSGGAMAPLRRALFGDE